MMTSHTTASSSRQSVKKSSVLLVLPAEGLPTASLSRAWAIAGIQDVELHVLRIEVEPQPAQATSPQNHILTLQARFAAEGRRVSETFKWLAGVTGRIFPQRQVHIRTGHFQQHVVERAKDLRASLIVLTPSQVCGIDATEIAHACNVPVMVARTPGSSDTIVVATDLRDPRRTVLHSAAKLGLRYESKMVAVHNFCPTCAPSMIATSVRSRGQGAPRNDEQERSAALQRATNELQLRIEARLERAYSNEEGILNAARSATADPIVIGYRRRSWLANRQSPGLASSVASNSQRSVLVVPIAAN